MQNSGEPNATIKNMDKYKVEKKITCKNRFIRKIPLAFVSELCAWLINPRSERKKKVGDIVNYYGNWTWLVKLNQDINHVMKVIDKIP